MGGGIIPVAFHQGKRYLLFGKEVVDGKWSDFGGGKEGNESSFKTAIREGCEELSGFLGCKAKLNKIVNEHKIIHLRAITYNSYLFEIKYDPNLPVYFNNNFSFIKKNFPDLLATDGMFEKSEIKWFEINSLRNNRWQFRPFYRHMVDVIVENKENIK